MQTSRSQNHVVPRVYYSYPQEQTELCQKTLPSNHPNLIDINNNIGLVYENTGKYSKAIKFFKQAVEIAQNVLPPSHPNLQQWQERLDSMENTYF